MSGRAGVVNKFYEESGFFCTQARGYRGADIGRVGRRSTNDPNATSAETQKKLAEKYAEFFSVLLKHKKEITRVAFWGVYDATSWIGGSPLLFDRNYRPKGGFLRCGRDRPGRAAKLS